MKNRVCEILNIQYPVIQGPMPWITSSELVAAVSNAGGLGVLGTSADYTEIIKGIPENVEAMLKTIRKTRELTDKPFGINVFPADADPYGFSKAMIALAKEEGVKILVVAGNVSPDEIKQWKEDGFIVIMREANPTVRGAQMAEEAGADIIVATGCDEGGCMPYLSTGTTAITALLADAVKIPVLAAGGIVNAKLAKAAKIVEQRVYLSVQDLRCQKNAAPQMQPSRIFSKHIRMIISFSHNRAELANGAPHHINTALKVLKPINAAISIHRAAVSTMACSKVIWKQVSIQSAIPQA